MSDQKKSKFGLGVLFGREELLNEMQPFLVGGGMISKVTLNKIEFASRTAQ